MKLSKKQVEPVYGQVGDRVWLQVSNKVGDQVGAQVSVKKAVDF